MKKYVYSFIFVLILILIPTKVYANEWSVNGSTSHFDNFDEAANYVVTNLGGNGRIDIVVVSDEETLSVPSGINDLTINASSTLLIRNIRNDGKKVVINNARVEPTSGWAIYNSANSNLTLISVDVTGNSNTVPINNLGELTIQSGSYKINAGCNPNYLIANMNILNIQGGSFTAPHMIVNNALGSNSTDSVVTNITGGKFKITDTAAIDNFNSAFAIGDNEGTSGKTGTINYKNATTDIPSATNRHFTITETGTLNIGEGAKFLVDGDPHDVIIYNHEGKGTINNISGKGGEGAVATKTSSVVEDSNETNPNTSDTKIFLLSVLSVFIIFIGTISYRKFRLIK